MEGMKECSTEEAVQQALVMQTFCVVFTRSNQETNKCFYQMPKTIAHEREKCKKLARKKHLKRIALHSLRSGGVK